MDDSELGQILSRADVPAPGLDRATLAHRVRRRARRRRRLRSGAAAAAVVCGIALFSALRSRHFTPAPPSQPAPPAQMAQATPRELSEQVAYRRWMIEGLLAAERRRAVEQELAGRAGSPRVVLDAQRDRAAGALIAYALELSRLSGHEPEAGREYRRVIELFPDSPLAMAAHRGLENLKGSRH